MFNVNCAKEKDRKGHLRIDCPDQNLAPPHHHNDQYSKVCTYASGGEDLESEGKCDNKRNHGSKDSDEEPLLNQKMYKMMTNLIILMLQKTEFLLYVSVSFLQNMKVSVMK